MLKKLEDSDYRQIFKDWVNKQPDDRQYLFIDSSMCAVGLFLRDNPEFNGGIIGYHEEVPMWRATHGEGPLGTEGKLYSSALSAGNPFSYQTFGDLKARLNSDPLWA